MINFLRLFAIVASTAVLAAIGILSCFVIPSGNGVLILARFWARLLLRICRVRVEVHGREKIRPPGPYLFFSNHQSQFDILAAVVTIPIQFRVLAKRELLYIPVFGWVIALAGFIGIDRTNREKAIKSLDRAAARIRKGTSLLIYAEGTRSPDGNLLPFKKGGFVLAIQAGVPVIPITIRGSREILPKKSLTIRPGTITVTVGDPINPREFSLENKEALMERVRAEMLEILTLHGGATGRARRRARPDPSASVRGQAVACLGGAHSAARGRSACRMKESVAVRDLRSRPPVKWRPSFTSLGSRMSGHRVDSGEAKNLHLPGCVAQGVQVAFAALFNRHGAMVLCWLTRIHGDRTSEGTCRRLQSGVLPSASAAFPGDLSP